MKTFWTSLPHSTPRTLTSRGEKDDGKRECLGGGDGDRVAGAESLRRDEVARLADRRPQYAGKASECDGDGSEGAGLDHGEERAAVEEAEQRREGLAQVNVHAAGLGHHGGELTVAERPGNGEDARDHPCDEQPASGTDLPRDLRRDYEDVGADHDAGDDHDGIDHRGRRRAGVWIGHCGATRQGRDGHRSKPGRIEVSTQSKCARFSRNVATAQVGALTTSHKISTEGPDRCTATSCLSACPSSVRQCLPCAVYVLPLLVAAGVSGLCVAFPYQYATE